MIPTSLGIRISRLPKSTDAVRSIVSPSHGRSERSISRFPMSRVYSLLSSVNVSGPVVSSNVSELPVPLEYR